MARKVKDARAAKDAKQKKIAIVGAILLVAVLAFQVPRTMKMLNGAESSSAAPAAPAPAAPSGSTSSLEPPSLGGTGTATPVSSETPAEAGGVAGRLVSFNRFASKDPFRPQVDAAELAGGGDDGLPGELEEVPAEEETAGGSGSTPSGGATPRPTPPPVNTSSAVISVNGVPETVAVGAEFPAAEPTFELVSLTAKAAKIAIAGGSYASGAPTMTLRRGKTLTLMNTSDGRRYELRWLPDSAAPAPAPAAAPAATPAATPAPSGS